MGGREHKERALSKLEAINHPLRLAILTTLSLKPASAKEMSDVLGAPLGKVRYQLDRLRKAGIAEVKEKRQRRGVSEQVYVARTDPFSEAEFAELSSAQKERVIADLLRAVVNDTAGSLRVGTFAKRDDFSLARLPLPLDEKGWADAVAISREAQDKLMKVGDESRLRLERAGGRTIEALAFLFVFEMGRPLPHN